jgi:hypothetical protein
MTESVSGSAFFSRRRRKFGLIGLVGVIVLALIVGIVFPWHRPVPPPTSAHVTIQALHGLSTLSPISIGLNGAVFDSSLLANSTRAAIKNAGVDLLRFPGGLHSDLYHWQSHTLIQQTLDPHNTFDAFMGVVQSTSSQAMITVNYGSGTAAEAAGWVQYANKGGSGYTGPVPTYAGGSRTGHTYGITYWEIGNEVYGDGTFVTSWEYNDHDRGSLAYARGVVAYSRAMKAVDPSIKIGAVLTAPGVWPDDVISPLSRRPWNQTVLSTACAALDFVVVHWYAQSPGQESDAALLSSTTQIASMVSTLRSEIAQSCGSHASNVQIMLTETNSVSYHPGKQTVSQVNALFLADDYLSWLEQGVTSVDWWNLHDGWAPTEFNNSSSLQGEARFGDYGLLSSHHCDGSICEPAVNTPFPPYYALQLLSYLGKPGDTFVEATSNHQLITPYAVRQRNGDLALLLLNKDPTTTSTVSITLNGYTARAQTTTYTYGERSQAILSASGSSSRVTLAPYSLTVVILSPLAIS